MDDKSRSITKATFTEYLRNKGLRKTPERFAILDKVCDMDRHFDIETLYAAIEAEGFHVSRATLYNNMELFVDCGIVRKHQFGSQSAQYEREIGTTNHLHLICRQCGKIKEVNDPELVKFMSLRRYSAFHSMDFCLYVRGICAACARRNKRKK